MKLPLRRHRNVSRGQALVEFAIILPVLALLMLLALDLGRVFFGWVALNNATRIAANEAAKNPDAWASGVGDPAYYLKISKDLQALNCDADTNNDGVIDATDLPKPDFTERDGDPLNKYEAGDLVSVTLHCGFSPLTPWVGNIVGDPMSIGATSTFLVFGGKISGIPVAPNPEPAGCIGADKTVPNMIGLSMTQARSTWTAAGFTGSFTPATGSDTNIVLTQTSSPASSPGACLVYYATVSVTSKVPDNCLVTERVVPSLVTLTVAQARTAWAGAGFTGGFTPLTGSDTNIVSAQVTSTGKLPGECSAASTYVTVTHAPPPPPAGYCTMTQVIGLSQTAAKTSYQNAGFTGRFSIRGNTTSTWVVKTQDLVGGQVYPCSANLQVQLKQP